VNAARIRLVITDALAQLPAEHREVINRSYYLGWTTAQIAEDLHVTEWFVKSGMHSALRALRLTLERQPSGGALNAAGRRRLRALLATAWGDRKGAGCRSPGPSGIRKR
jgi:hypothetical protein